MDVAGHPVGPDVDRDSFRDPADTPIRLSAVAAALDEADLIDGELEIESEPDRGTSVRLRVPLAGKAS